MTTIVTRAGKGSPLTHTEVDTNFTNLNTAKLEAGAIALGSAAAPSISFVSDTNTGIFSPGADQVAISTNGTQKLIVLSDGKVGIGTSAPAQLLEAQDGNIQVRNSSSLSVGDVSTYGLTFRNTNQVGQDRGTIAAIKPYLATAGDNDFGLQFQTQATTAGGVTTKMTLTPGGSLGIGTTGPSVPLHIVNPSTAYVLAETTGTGTSAGFRLKGSASADYTIFTTQGANQFAIYDNAASSQRLTIDSSGRLLVGTTTNLFRSAQLQVKTTGGYGAIITQDSGSATNEALTIHHTNTSGNNLFIAFGTEGAYSNRGDIDYNRAAGLVRYNVTSDRRLKSEIQPATSALDDLAAIQVRAYKWTETGYQINYGFVAQELYEVAPDAVKEGDDSEEITDVWAVDNSKLVPLLTKALQDAVTKIEILEARLTAAGID